MKAITCLQNPQLGRENEFEIRTSKSPKRVAVVGGGPAGGPGKYARVAALRGHQVTLYERIWNRRAD